MGPNAEKKKIKKKRDKNRSQKLLLTVGLGDALNLVLLLDGVRVGRALGRVDQLVGQALGDRLDVAEGRLARARRQQVDGLVDAPERRDVDGLPAHDAGRADPRRVLARAAVDDRVDEHLDRVGVGQQVDDLEGVLDDARGHQLLAVVAAVLHQRADEALSDRALRLAEAPLLVAAGGVRDEDGLGLDGDVVLDGEVVDLLFLVWVGEGAASAREEEREKRERVSVKRSSVFFFQRRRGSGGGGSSSTRPDARVDSSSSSSHRVRLQCDFASSLAPRRRPRSSLDHQEKEATRAIWKARGEDC